MDLYDLSESFGSMENAMSRISGPVLVIGVKTDILFPVWQQRHIAEELKKAGGDHFTMHIYEKLFFQVTIA